MFSDGSISPINIMIVSIFPKDVFLNILNLYSVKSITSYSKIEKHKSFAHVYGFASHISARDFATLLISTLYN